MMPLPVYLDYSATTPCDERVVQEMLPYFTTYFGNASSKVHSLGWQAESAVAQARERIATLIGANHREIIFTSGATEACNLALRGVWDMYAGKGNHIITTATEHKAVLYTCKALKKKGVDITFLKVNEEGLIDIDELAQSIKDTTVMVSIMFANNETGVVQPIKEIGILCKQRNVIFFCDATQAVGKIPVEVNQHGIDVMSFSSHKLYGPKGVGALYIRSRNPRVKITAQITGGGQENNLRSGTLNVPGIVGFGKACELCYQEMPVESKRMVALCSALKKGLLEIPQTFLNGHNTERLPHILNISFGALNSNLLLGALSKNMALSSGSACTSGSLQPSYVLSAMGIVPELSKAALRLSIGRFTTYEEIQFALSEVSEKVVSLRMNNQ